MQAQAEWKDWFALPYMKDPHESPAFSIYFSRHWQVILPNYFHRCSRSIVLSVSVRYLFLHSSSAVISFIRSSLLLSCGVFGCTVKQEGTSSHRCTYWVLVLVPWVVW
jgi:hypothetical protein